ncbi:MAG TPA: adenylate/guanylate cyclase domain-containing protein, partial [Acidimicrobiales bacterium]
MTVERGTVPENGTATATIVFTDVMGSSQVRARVGTLAPDRLRPDHHRDLAQIAITHGGRVVTAASDGILAAFDAATDAVMAAVAMQRHMAPTDVTIGVGVASGNVSWDGGACFGFPVIIATRLQDAAADGQILVSRVVRSLAGDRAGDRYTDLGSRALTGVAEPVDVFEMAWDPPEKPDGRVAPGVVPLPTELTVRPGFQFVGRADEWEALNATWSEVESGGRKVVLLSGEAGAGKTRLAFEFARQCHGEGAAVLFGGCDSELGVPFQPWVQAFVHLLGSLPDELLIDDLAPELSELAVILPQLDRFVPGLLRSSRVDPETDRYRLFGAVDTMLVKASTLRPVVLVLDDLHWAGAQTLALLRHLARSGS